MTYYVRRFTDPHAFYEHVGTFLMRREAEHNLIIGLTSALRNGEFLENPPYLAAVEHDGEIVMAALRTPPYNLILSMTNDTAAIQPLLEDVYSMYPTLPAVFTAAEWGEQLAQQWQALSGQTYKKDIAERIYRLERVNPVSGVAGRLRSITEQDRDLFKGWMMAFHQEAFGRPDEAIAEDTTRRMLRHLPEQQGGFVWEVDGQPVSMALYRGPTPNGFRIGMVYTPPELRGKGYASACVAAISQHILDMGRKFCFLFTDLANPTSNHIYQVIGYEPVCDIDIYKFS